MSIPIYQQIRARFQLGPAIHMTHLSNLPSILREGELRSHTLMAGRDHRSVANEDVQAGRAAKVVPLSGRALHDYVPLYFGVKTPMVAVNQDQNEAIVFLRFSLDVFLSIAGVVISDGNARSNVTRFFLFAKIDDLSVLDVAAIHTYKYARDPELKRKKQAEILVPDHLPMAQLFDIICFSVEARSRVLEILDNFGINKPVYVGAHYYFRNTLGSP